MKKFVHIAGHLLLLEILLLRVQNLFLVPAGSLGHRLEERPRRVKRFGLLLEGFRADDLLHDRKFEGFLRPPHCRSTAPSEPPSRKGVWGSTLPTGTTILKKAVSRFI